MEEAIDAPNIATREVEDNWQTFSENLTWTLWRYSGLGKDIN